MRNIDDTLAQLSILWKQHPELRLGQLIELHNTGIDTFYIEDQPLLDSIEVALTTSEYQHE